MVCRKVVLVIALLIGLTLPACGGKPTPDVRAIETQTAASIFATQTANAPTLTSTPLATVTPLPCSVQAQEFLAQAQALLEEWDDTNQVASKTGRIALNQPVSQLQGIHRQLDAKDAPECASAIKLVMSAYMDATIDAYLAFMGQASNVDMTFETGKAAALQILLDEVMIKVVSNETVMAYPVNYRVGGVDNLRVTYKPMPSVSLGPRFVDNPWSESSVALSEQAVQITVKNNIMESEVFCEIWVNGTLVKRVTSTEPRSEFTCDYTMP